MIKFQNINRTLVVTGLATLASLTLASGLAMVKFAGVLSSGDVDTYHFTVGRGEYTVSALGDGDVDIDAYVFDDCNELLGKDTLPDDEPVVTFYSDHAQTVTIKIKNAGRNSDAYSGNVSP